MWLQRIVIIVGFFCRSLALGAIDSTAANSPPPNSVDAGESESPPRGVGSIPEYLGKDPNLPSASLESLAGISVFETHAIMISGQNLAGIGVLSVEQPSPADEAGIRSEAPTPLAELEEVGVGVLTVGILLAFPPALFGSGLMPKLNFPKAYDVIIAVDAVRTRSITDLEAALRKAHAGEPVYLTIIRSGRRRQLRLVAPDSFNSVP